MRGIVGRVRAKDRTSLYTLRSVFRALPCFAWPSSARPCRARLCFASPSLVPPCETMLLCHALPCSASPRRAAPSSALLRLAALFQMIQPCHAVLGLAVPCRAPPCHAVPGHAVPSLVIRLLLPRRLQKTCHTSGGRFRFLPLDLRAVSLAAVPSLQTLRCASSSSQRPGTMEGVALGEPP